MKSSQDSPPIGVCAVLQNSRSEILMGRRKNSYKSGYYGLPGGRVEVNESLESAIRREVEEETGISIAKFEYIGVVRENQGNYDFIHFVFAASDVTDQPVLCEPEKCEGWEWTVDGDAEKNLLPGHQAAIELITAAQKLIDITL